MRTSYQPSPLKKLAIVGGLVAVIALVMVLYNVATAPEGTPVDEEYEPSEQPLQEEVEGEDAKPFMMEVGGGEWFVTRKARYRIAARILGTERYRWGWQGDLCPVDLALGWGPMADPEVDEYISWSQYDRFYFYEWPAGSPYRSEQIIPHSANVHIFPATDNLKEALTRLDEDDVILLEGFLVSIEGNYDGERYWWHSSLTRTDIGEGSCELLYAERLVSDGMEYR